MRLVLALVCMLNLGFIVHADEMGFDRDWRFCLENLSTAMMPDYDDSDWRKVDLPHDWSVEGPFDPKYGSGNGFAPGGIAWYRKAFQLNEDLQDKRVIVLFDGVYNNAEVWINGHFIGGRPSGYHSFYFDLTPHMQFGESDNVLAVRVDHSRFSDSRWYTGSGIYRHVHLLVTDKLHIPVWGVYVTTPDVSPEQATAHIQTQIMNDRGIDQVLEFNSTILSPEGQEVETHNEVLTLPSGREAILKVSMPVPNPQVWDLDTPRLYSLKSQVWVDGQVVDEQVTPFGIRTIRFDADQGFFLNGRSVKLKGVCLHHDAGSLGAAVPDQVLQRRLRLMKDLGANAIRTSHNPPAPELLEMCDRLGLLVKDESFDEFAPPKNKWVMGWNDGQPSRFGYGEVFTEWGVRDMQDLVQRDRNHPCVIMWSIGNEIDYANDPFSHPVLGDEYKPTQPRAELMKVYAEPLVSAVKELDVTRPVTAALANVPMSNAVGLPECLDIVGYNYQERYYEADHAAYPQRVIFGSENGDSYEAWQAVVENDYIAGQFLWTGIDYLGEAYRWPNRANGAGLLDLCGFKKPIGWFRQSLWSDTPMVYACVTGPSQGRRRRSMGQEHWNWTVGEEVTVRVMTNCESAVLHLNGQRLPAKERDQAEGGILTWQVPYQAGTLKAIGMDQGQEVTSWTLTTAGPAHHLELFTDVTELRSGSQDIAHVTIRVVDEVGVRVATNESEVCLEMAGPVRLLGLGSGNINDVDNSLDTVHRLYQGRGLAVIQAGPEIGDVTLRVRAEGLEPAEATVVCH